MTAASRKTPPRYRRLKRVAAAGIIAGVILVAATLWAKNRSDARYFEGYNGDLPLDVHIKGGETFESHVTIELSFIGVEGERVPTVLAIPSAAAGPVPCVIFLHGVGQTKDFLSRIVEPFVSAGFAITTFDQYTRGERKQPDLNFFREAFAARRRGALTVLETRRLIDFLETRKEIDPQRIYLIGASYGAMTGAIAAAFEPRIRACNFIYGGADFPRLFKGREIRNAFGVFTSPVAALVAWFLKPADPITYVGQIAPRPILFQNGRRDGLIPAESAKAFHAAAGEPKTIVWYDSDHIGLDEEHVDIVLNASVQWFTEYDTSISREALVEHM